MKIVIAPDSFKESLSAPDVAEAIARGWRRVFPQAEVLLRPLADGGEGTVDAVLAATAGERRECRVEGPLGEPTLAHWGWLDDATAVIEMASASGLHLVPRDRRDATRSSSRGTGELIRAALDAGARKIILGLGGSAASEMAVLMGLCQNGQAINLSEPLKQAGVTSAEALLRQRRQNGARLTLAQTFPTGTHALWLNYWLASIGLHPLHDVHSVVVPPAQMVGHLQAGRIDGFCAGGPWGALAVDQGQGFTIATSQAIWPDHPEKVLGTTRAFVDAYPNTARALVMAVLDASRFIEQNAENRLGTAQLISGRDYVDAPLGAIQPRFFGRYQDGLGNAWQDPHPLRFYADGEVNRPWLSDGMWFMTQFRRWGLLREDPDYLGIARRVQQTALYRDAATALGLCLDGADMRRSTLIDGRTWDGSDPAGYARSFPIHALAETGQGIDL